MAASVSLSPLQAFEHSDRVMALTRWLAVFIIPFLIAAAAILYLMPTATEQLFAWPIKPTMTAMMLGAAYIGGAWFFIRVTLARKWHTVKAGFLPVIAFASLLGIATILHWDKFTHNHVSFWAWAGLYFTTPFLVVGVWWLNRRADPGTPEPGEAILPTWLRWLIGIVGAASVVVALLLFIQPGVMIAAWPWTLTPLTARTAGAMFALPGVVGLAVATDRRWSSARIIFESQALSIILILVAAARAWTEFNFAQPLAWLFLVQLAGLLILIVVLYVLMQVRQRKPMTGTTV
jgi:hypothetical protein